jgi:hypothetical protein
MVLIAPPLMGRALDVPTFFGGVFFGFATMKAPFRPSRLRSIEERRDGELPASGQPWSSWLR